MQSRMSLTKPGLRARSILRLARKPAAECLPTEQLSLLLKLRLLNRQPAHTSFANGNTSGQRSFVVVMLPAPAKEEGSATA